jgi:hypothetical protein
MERRSPNSDCTSDQYQLMDAAIFIMSRFTLLLSSKTRRRDQGHWICLSCPWRGELARTGFTRPELIELAGSEKVLKLILQDSPPIFFAL